MKRIIKKKISAFLISAALILQAVPCQAVTLEEIPPYSGEPYCVLNDNVPDFAEEEITDESFESYSELDELGRCGAAFACLGTDLMPTEKRGNIGSVKPSGWHAAIPATPTTYYNRCHLIGFQLSGENANERNLVTGTRYMNVDGMLPYENLLADYIKETDSHVMYRVTPLFEGDNLVASGVEMEAMSVEDQGEDILFHVFCYNVQPGIVIDYRDGSCREGDPVSETFAGKNSATDKESQLFILNINSGKFHLPSCTYAEKIKEGNRKEISGTKESLEQSGYSACRQCIP